MRLVRSGMQLERVEVKEMVGWREGRGEWRTLG